MAETTYNVLRIESYMVTNPIGEAKTYATLKEAAEAIGVDEDYLEELLDDGDGEADVEPDEEEEKE